MSKAVDQQFEAFKAHGNLPSPRGVALQIIQLADRDDTTIGQIARLIGSDPVLAGNIVKVANLLTHRGSRPIASVTDAVTIQGIKSVRQLALSLSLVDAHRSGACAGFDYQKFWAHSVCTGIAAQQIVANMQVGVADEAFLLGLLSQIGRLALAAVFPAEYAGVLTADNLTGAEHAAFGIDHNQITAGMLADWGMPKLFQEISLHIEHPEASEFHEGERNWRFLQLMHFSDRLAAVCTAEASERYRLIPRLMLLATRVGIESGTLIEIGDRVIASLREWSALLGIFVPALPPFEEMLNADSMASELLGLDALPGSLPVGFKLRILLVDDDRAIRLLYKTLLEKSGRMQWS